MLRSFIAPLISLLWFGLPAGAVCVGDNLFNALAPEQQARLTADANAAPWAEGLVFGATKGAQQLTLIGTYHMPDDRVTGFLDTLTPALDGAKALLVEAGPEEQKTLKDAMSSDPDLTFITSGPTLPEQLSDADWQRLINVAEEHGLPAVVAAKMKPALLAMMLAIPTCATPELAQGKGGVDMGLIAAAQARGLPIRAVEPWNTVFTLFDRIAPADSLDLLRAATAEADETPAAMATMSDLYFERKPRLIFEMSRLLATRAGESPELVDRQMQLTDTVLTAGRNHAWIPVIEAAAAEGPVVVAVGALHLSGKEGVLELLRADGWTITRKD